MKVTKFFIIAAIAGAMLTGCSKNNGDEPKDPSVYDEGVVINGVKWATRNVGAFGKFAAAPESSGMFYQWNRKVAYPATGDVSEIWDDSSPNSNWDVANDPSPLGWHVPTKTDFDKLLDVSKVDFAWTTENGVFGGLFTDKISYNSIFLPAAGMRHCEDLGTDVTGVGEVGCYWSSSTDGYRAIHLNFYLSDVLNIMYDNYAYGFSIRPVKNNPL